MVKIDMRTAREKYSDEYFEKYNRYPPDSWEPFWVICWVAMIGTGLAMLLLNFT
jgi:hypothetical protein